MAAYGVSKAATHHLVLSLGYEMHVMLLCL